MHGTNAYVLSERDAFGEARREQSAELRAVLIGDQMHGLDVHGIEHRYEILHLHLERWQVARRHTIG